MKKKRSDFKEELKEKIENAWAWYILGEYHCDHCPYSWEERGTEDANAGCFLFGELRDTCRHIRNPISQIIVNKHMNEYVSQWVWEDEYGDILEICERLQQDIFRDMDEVNKDRLYEEGEE